MLKMNALYCLLFDSYLRYGIEFQVIDMRWGQRDESTDDHQTMTICLEEVCSSTRNVPYLLRARIFKIKYVVNVSFLRQVIYRASKIFQYSI